MSSPILRLIDWHLPLACISVVLLSTLYTYHNYHQLLHNCSEQQMLQELASMQIMGIVLASAAASAFRRATSGSADHSNQQQHSKLAMLQHPLMPMAAARRRQQLPLV